jgi:protein-glucosylgalactosylhydroxylysine glucosidase
MWRLIFTFYYAVTFNICGAQDPWKISASTINPNNYYGITVANGMIGIVSSPEPFKVKDVVLAGAGSVIF